MPSGGWGSGNAKNVGTAMLVAAVPPRLVIRIARLATWTTWSGPTATVEFAGSTAGLAWSVSARPPKPARWLSGAVVWPAWTGPGAASGRTPPAADLLNPPAAAEIGRLEAWVTLRASSVRRAVFGPVAYSWPAGLPTTLNGERS